MIKKNILTFTTVLSLALIGCGGDDATNPFENKVTFKTSGTYNLMDYMVGEPTKSYNYVDKYYKDTKGDKNYPEPQESDATTTYTIDGQKTNVLEDGDLDHSLTSSTDRITFADIADDENRTMFFSKFAEKGNQVLNYSKTKNSTENNVVCTIMNHLATKEVRGKSYSDVLEITCQYKATFKGTVNNQEINTIETGNDTSFYAKSTGLISLRDESCTETTLNNNKTNQCSKQLSDISTIN